MVPRLSKGIVDKHNWDRFLGFIINHYADDPQVEVKPNYILFNVGEHSILPFEGHKLLRFSSKVSGSIAAATAVEKYVDFATKMADAHFGCRIKHWNEAADQYGVYDWNEVHASIDSYEQVRHSLTDSFPCYVAISDSSYHSETSP